MEYSNNVVSLVNVDILHNGRLQLVQDLVVENVLPGMTPFLSVDEQERIEAAGSRGEKTMSLIDFIIRKTSSRYYSTYIAFMNILAGTQPELFTSVVGRPPAENEIDFCVRNISDDLKKNILEKGHKTDSPLDEEIDFRYQHVQLHMIRSDPQKEHFDRTDAELLYSGSHDSQLPHEYQYRLSEMEKKDENMPVCDILEAGGKLHKRVLMIGRSGVGKSTTLQFLARQWALSEWAAGFTVLFLMQLRMLSHTDTSMTAIELLTMYGMFEVGTSGIQNVLCAWLQNSVRRTIILVDGVDEILRFAEKFDNSPKITDMKQKANPIDLCINILRGDLLPGCTIVCTSRPFTGISKFSCDSAFEILGLTKIQIKEYVHKRYPARGKEIMLVLKGNPLLLSVCGITFYCMAICNLIMEGVTFMDSDFQTYSRLTAFIMVQYISRKLSEWPFVIEVSSYFPKLAHLAYKGIFQSSEEGSSKMTFNEYDLAEVGLTPSKLEKIKRVGILRVKEIKTNQGDSLSAEFLHLTAQEMLAVAYLLSNPLPSKHTLKNVFSGGHFNMALMYLFGLTYDKSSKWINDVCKAVNPKGFCVNDDINTHILEILSELSSDLRNKLRICQLIYEGHVEAQARHVVGHIIPHGILLICKVPMTAIDMKAISFVCQHSETLTEITLIKVNADDTLIEILSSLIRYHIKSVQSLDLSDNNIDVNGAKALAEVVQQSKCLEKLDVSHNCIGADGGKALAEALRTAPSLRVLNISGNHIGVAGTMAIAKALKYNNTLQVLNISYNDISVAGAEALGEAVCTNTGLQELDMSCNEIGDDGLKAVADALFVNKTLVKLAIQGDKIGYEGADILAEAFGVNLGLQTLTLYDNNIQDRGAKALAEGLWSNVSLKMLDVGHNNIGPDGASALAEVMHENKCLEEIDLSWNHHLPVKMSLKNTGKDHYSQTVTIRDTRGVVPEDYKTM